jgi:hypothetical protein
MTDKQVRSFDQTAKVVDNVEVKAAALNRKDKRKDGLSGFGHAPSSHKEEATPVKRTPTPRVPSAMEMAFSSALGSAVKK